MGLRLAAFLLLFVCTVAFRPYIGQRHSYKPKSRTNLLMDYNWKDARKSAETKMTKSIESLQSQLSTIRVGAASPSLLDRVMVDYFGTPTPVPQVARVAASALQLVVEPFDKAITKDIEKAILTSDLNLTPSSDGYVIRINLPPLTAERRKDLAKQAHASTEGGKVAVRNIRRDVLEKVKAAEKAKEIGKDDSKGYQVRTPCK
jgi:ribosome recycling factor